MKRIAVMTSGGDSAGMNAALRAVVRSALHEGLEVVGVQRGFRGIVEHDYVELSRSSVSGVVHRGGTVLRTFRAPEFLDREVRDGAREGFLAQGADGLVVIGGDGSFRGAHCIDTEWGVPCLGVPATIDNDIMGSGASIGFDTALNIAVDAVDKIRDTATSHGRIFVIEVMGRHSGMLALACGLSCGAEEVLIPERDFHMGEICDRIENGYDKGKQHAILIVAEGAARAADVVAEIRQRLSREVRFAVLGHIQRGGEPTAFDRILASRLGYAALHGLVAGHHDEMVGLLGGRLEFSPLVKDGPAVQPVLAEYLRLMDALN